MDFLNKFLENSFVPLYAITALLALVKYPKYYTTSLKYLPIIFAYTFFNELLGILILRNEEFSLFMNDRYSYYNVVIYNIYSIIFYLYFYYVFWDHLQNEKHKALVLRAGLLFIIVSIINPIFQNFMLEAQVYTYVVGALILLTCIVLYLLQLKKSGPTYSLKRDLLAWLSLGLSIFYIGYLPIKINRHYNAIHGLSEYVHLRKIHLSLILVMYTCFIIGFLRMRRRLSK